LYIFIAGKSALYDLVSTAAYPGLSPRMAMKIGSKQDPADLRLRHWESFWETIGFSSKQANKQTLNFLERIDQLLPDLASTEMGEKVQGIIQDRRRALSHLLHS